MRRTRYAVGAAILAVALAIGAAASAEPVSIRCSDGKAPRPYFVTFDLSDGKLVFEATTRSVHAGEIKSAHDDRIAFTIKVDHGNIDLVWERAYARVLWSGIGADWIRPILLHPCVITQARTMLSLDDDTPVDPVAGAEPFSLRCLSEPMPTHFTIDRAARRVVMESMSGMAYRGEIQDVAGNVVRFTVDTGSRPAFALTWDKEAANITIEGVPGDSSRPTTVIACSEIAPRSVMVLWRRLN